MGLTMTEVYEVASEFGQPESGPYGVPADHLGRGVRALVRDAQAVQVLRSEVRRSGVPVREKERGPMTDRKTRSVGAWSRRRILEWNKPLRRLGLPIRKHPPALTNVHVPRGALRVWWIPQVPGARFFVPVDDLTQAKLVLETLARYDLFQFRERIKPDYASVGGLEVFEDGEWCEWNDENGDDIDAVICVERAA